MLLGTFHEREGDQTLVSEGDAGHAGWIRTFGGTFEQRWTGYVAPTFDGNVSGVQMGLPVYDFKHADGQADRFGVFFGYALSAGQVRGFSLGYLNLPVGDLNMNTYGAGAYWTHTTPGGAYVDTVMMYSWLNANANSLDGISTGLNGRSIAISSEAGLPISIGGPWKFEPQAQMIWQHQAFDTAYDMFSAMDFKATDAFTGRIGFRLGPDLDLPTGRISPYLRANVWHTFSGDSSVLFNNIPILTTLNATLMQVGGGITAEVNKSLAVYATLDRTFSLDNNTQQAFEARGGLRAFW